MWWSIHFEGGAKEEHPEIEVRLQRLDQPDRDPMVNEDPGTNAHTSADGWFMINGLQPNEPGCWRVTASYRGEELSYTYLIEEHEADEAMRSAGFSDPELAGLCEDVDTEVAEETPGAPTPDDAIEAFLRENAILQDKTRRSPARPSPTVARQSARSS